MDEGGGADVSPGNSFKLVRPDDNFRCWVEVFAVATCTADVIMTSPHDFSQIAAVLEVS